MGDFREIPTWFNGGETNKFPSGLEVVKPAKARIQNNSALGSDQIVDGQIIVFEFVTRALG
jgi:hypothetical protein